VKLEPGAELTLLENGPAAARFNKVLEVEVADGAQFHHIRAQGRDHERRAVTHIFARLGAESLFKSFTLTANGRLTRNEAVIELTGRRKRSPMSPAAPWGTAISTTTTPSSSPMPPSAAKAGRCSRRC
jgi:hypothetical protein